MAIRKQISQSTTPPTTPPGKQFLPRFRTCLKPGGNIQSIELTFDRRLINGWSFGGSIIYSDSRGNIHGWAAYQGGYTPVFNDPNWTVNNTENSRPAGYTPWMMKLYGSFDIPLGFLASFSWRGMSGGWTMPVITTYAPNDWIIANNVRPGAFYPNTYEDADQWRRPFENYMDVRLEKEFKFLSGKLGIFIDVFNLFGYRWAQLGDNPGGVYRPAAEGTSVGGTYTPGNTYGGVYKLNGTRDIRFSARFTF